MGLQIMPGRIESQRLILKLNVNSSEYYLWFSPSHSIQNISDDTRYYLHIYVFFLTVYKYLWRVKVKQCDHSQHGSMTEKEIHLFFSDIIIYLSKSFFLYINDFLIVWNQGTLRISRSIAFETVKSYGEKKQHDFGAAFVFFKIL